MCNIPCVVSSSADETHGKDGVVGDVIVGVVGILVEYVDDGQLWVGDGTQSDSQRHRPTHGWLAVTTLRERL